MAICSEVLEGDDAALQLPRAYSELRKWGYANAPQSRFQAIPVENGWIYLRRIVVAGQAQDHIRIVVGRSLRYEWFISGHVDDTLSSPGFPGYVGGEALRATFGGSSVTFAQLFSTELVPGPNDTWLLRDVDAPGSRTSRFITWASWQNQKFQNRAWHMPTGGLVTSTQSQPGGLLNKCGWRDPYLIQPYWISGGFDTDYGLDVPPALYEGGTAIIGAPVLEQPWLWWRAAAVQSAGGRKFFICSDNYGRFHVYVVKERPFFLTLPGEFKTYTPPYPAWVTVPDPNDPVQFDRDWLWRFNSDATKCVSIPFHSEPCAHFLKYSQPPPWVDPGNPPARTLYATLSDDPGVLALIKYPEFLNPAMEDTPGIVEFGIAITSTGDGDMDFDVEFTLLRNSYFGDTQRFYFDAAYSLPDVEHVPPLPTDTLVTAEIECKVPPGDYIAEVHDTSPPYPLTERDWVQNMRAYCVMNVNDQDMIQTEKYRFPIANPAFFTYAPDRPEYAGLANTTYFGLPEGYNTLPTNGTPGTVDFYPAGPWASPAPVFAREGGRLYSMELSTLSLVHSQFSRDTGDHSIHGIAYGEEFFASVKDPLYPIAPGTPPPWPPPLEVVSEVVPSTRPYQTMLQLLLGTNVGSEFCVHPTGNWSLAPSMQFYDFSLGPQSSDGSFPITGLQIDHEAYQGLDWISVVTGRNEDGTVQRTRYRHKELYNTAFGQTRDYPFYETDAFTGKGFFDRGVFRVGGYWVSS